MRIKNSLLLLFAVCLVALTFVPLYCSKRVADTMDVIIAWPEKIARGASRLLQAKTTINSTSISLPEQDILEVNLVQRRIVCYTKQENAVLGSSATRIIKGVFEIKAGYDLKGGFQITFDEGKKALYVALPEPKINSIETVSQETFYLDRGVIKREPNTFENDEGNRLNLEAARKEAVELGLTTEITDRMKERIYDIFSPLAREIHITESTTEVAPYPSDQIGL